MQSKRFDCMTNIIDFYDDKQKLIFNIIDREFKLPTSVKTASLEDVALTRKEKKAFALPLEKKFPLDTAEDIILSHLYLKKTASRLDKSSASFAQNAINKAASFANVDLTNLNKKPVLEYEIDLKDFAIAIPKERLDIETRTKAANYIYNDHFCLYPLDTPENIKTANLMFPRGLEEFPELKPIIASKILDKVDEDELSPRVAEYRPISKSAMLQQLELREALNPIEEYPNAYSFLAKEFKTAPDTLANRQKFASILTELDKRSGVANLPKRQYTGADKFLCGWEEDLEKRAHVIIDDREFSMKHIQKYASMMEQVYPESRHYIKSVDSFEKFLSNKNDHDLNVLKGIFTSRL